VKPPREIFSCQWHEKAVEGTMNSAKTWSTAGVGELSLVGKERQRERGIANLESERESCGNIW
jgi:hypothetical protein